MSATKEELDRRYKALEKLRQEQVSRRDAARGEVAALERQLEEERGKLRAVGVNPDNAEAEVEALERDAEAKVAECERVLAEAEAQARAR